MRTRNTWWAWAAVFAALWCAGPAHAAPPDRSKIVEGVVVRVADGEVIVDVGRREGLTDKAIVQIYRRVEIQHPVTRKKMVDRFPIGGLVLTEVGQLLSISKGWGELVRTPQVGDFVVFEATPEPTPIAAPTPSPDGSPLPAPMPMEPADPALADFERFFQKTLGQPLTDRIAVWEIYLQDHPDSPYLDQVGQELNWLRVTLARERKMTEAPEVPKEPAKLATRVAVPSLAVAGERLEMQVVVVERELADTVRVLWRRGGEPTFQTLPMTRDGDYNWRAEFEGEAVEEGVLEYFVEIVRSNSQLEAASGASAQSPAEVVLVKPVESIFDDSERSRSTTIVEFVDFKTGDQVDEYIRIESEFRYRIDYGLLTAFSAGIGIFQGEGGTLAQIESGQTRQRNVNFGFAQLELNLGKYVGVSGRVSAGNHHQTLDNRGVNIFGLRSELRIGEVEGTRLTAGVSFTEDVGNEAWTELTLAVFEDWPISAGVAVTNLPVGGDLGVSASLGVGPQITDWLALSLRTGWNARTINHYGFTLGAGALITW